MINWHRLLGVTLADYLTGSPYAVELEHPRNALWGLFSADPQRFRDGAEQYHWRQADPLPVIGALNEHYQQLGITMAYTLTDLYRDFTRQHLSDLTPEERLQGLPPEERLRLLLSDKLLQDLDDDGIEKLIERLQHRRTGS